MKVPSHLNYTQAFAGPFRPTPPGTVVSVTPLLGMSGAFPGNAGPFVSPPTGYAGFGAEPAAKTPVVAVEPAGPTPTPAPGPMPRVAVAADDSSGALRMINKVAGYAGYMAGAYHGYKRNESVGWAFGWALFGGLIWPLAIPVMFAQGFGKPIAKQATANRRAKRNGFKVRTGDLVPLGRLGDIDDSQRDLIAYRDTSGWDLEVRKFASRSSMKEFLKKEARKSDYGAHGKREWRALVKDIVGKNMVAYPSFEKES